MKSPSNPGLRRTYVNLKKANWDRYRQEVEAALSKRSLPTDCQRDEKIFRTILLKAASHHIPTGRHRLHEEPVPAEILDVMNRRDDLRKRDPTSPELPRMNKDIQNRICVHKRKKWRDFVETMDQKTDVTKLWRTIKGIDGRAKREAENVAITFNGISFSSSKQLATKFNQQFNTSKLGRHTSSRETRVVTREAKRKSLEMAQSFTSDLVMKAIKSCRNSKAFGPDKLSIFHLKHLGPRAIEYITALFNLSVTTCQIPAIWKSSLIIPIPKPGKDTSQGTSYRPISLLCPAAKVMESLLLPTVNKYLLPAQDQHGFRREHSHTLYHRISWTTQHALSSDHLPIITTIKIRHDYRLQQNRRSFTNYKKADWTQFTEDTESAFAQTTIPINIHTANIFFHKHQTDGRQAQHTKGQDA